MGDESQLASYVVQGGAAGLIGLIVYRWFPKFEAALQNVVTQFREELKETRKEAANDRAKDGEARLAMAKAVQDLTVTISQELGPRNAADKQRAA
jgi:hypothetical protein